jgi:hypothetical protein
VEAELSRLPQRHEIEAMREKLTAEDRGLAHSISTAKAHAAAEATRQARLAVIRPIAAALASAIAEQQDAEAQQKEAQSAASKARDDLSAARSRYTEAMKQNNSATRLNARVETLNRLIGLAEARGQKAEIANRAFSASAKKVGELAGATQAALKARDAAAAEVAKLASGEITEMPFRSDDLYSHANSGDYEAHVILRFEGGAPKIREVKQWRVLTTPTEEEMESRIMAEYEARQALEDAEQAVAEAQELVSSAYEEGERLQAALSVAEREFAECGAAMTELETLREAGVKPALSPAEIAELQNQAQAAEIDCHNTEAACNVALNRLNAAARATAASRSAAEEVTRIIAESKQSDSPEQVAQWTAQLADVRNRLTEVAATLESIIRLEQDRKRIADAARVRAEADERSKLAGKAVEVIAEKKREIVSLSIETPLAVANRLAAGILKGPLVFEQGEIGMRVEDRFVSNRLFSGTEIAILMIGLTAGLAARSKFRIVMLDEVGRLDAANAVCLIGNLLHLIDDGVIEQFMVIGPENPTLQAGLAVHDSKLTFVNV